MGLQSFTGPLLDTGGAAYNARAFGAAGDGVTSDSAAIAAALAALPASGGIVELPSGSFLLTSTLTIPAKATLRGAGMGKTTLLAPLSNANAVTVSGADVAIEHLCVDGRYASQTNNGSGTVQCGIALNSGSDRLRVTRCWVKDTCGCGISNIGNGLDLLVENCRITNGAVAASQVQATPAPTTTTFAVAPGTGANFAAGQSLRIGTQTGTVQSVTAVRSAVAAVSSTSVFTLNVGDGASFANGNVIRVGPNSGTISTVVGDVVTLTGALAALPIVGQIVAIDNITLTSAITLPVAGQVVAITGGYLKGIYCQGNGSNRPTIRNSYLSGWSQAIGFWFGTSDGLVDGNRLVANYGYEDASHTLNRSAIELYPNTAVGGHHRVTGNLIDGSTHCCLEYAQGEVGSVVIGNTMRNWAFEVGLTSDAGAVDVQGQAGLPGATEEALFLANDFQSNGAFQTQGITITASNLNTTNIKVEGNNFFGFSGHANSYPINVGGSNGPLILGNSFSYCIRAVFVNDVGCAAGVIHGNKVWFLPTAGKAIDLTAAGDGWLIASNSIDGDAVNGGYGVIISSGNKHRIIGNRISSTTPVNLNPSNDCVIAHNTLLKNINDGSGCVKISLASARNSIRDNVLSNAPGYNVSLEGTSDYNQVYRNACTGSTTALTGVANPSDLRVTSSGTHNYVDAQSNSTIAKPAGRKLIAGVTVNIAQTTIAHGLGYIPTQIFVLMTSAGNVWRSAAADATNVYLIADADGRTCDLSVR